MPSPSSESAQYLHIASLAIGAYDYLITLRAEYRFYTSQRRLGRITLSCALFILIRYFSIILLTLAATTWFGEFSLKMCKRLYIIPPVFKVLQAMVSQLVLGIRAYNLSQRSRNIGLVVLILYIGTSIPQWVAALSGPTATVNTDGTGCRRRSYVDGTFGTWTFYLVAIIYDFIITAISFRYLLLYYFSTTTSSVISDITVIMIYDGLGYFVMLTATNIFNMILFRFASQKIQSEAVSIGFVATWIMTQRILIDLHEASIARRSRNDPADVPPEATRSVHPPFESNKEGGEWTQPSLDTPSPAARDHRPLDVQVRVERRTHAEEGPWKVEGALCRPRVSGGDLRSYNSWTTASHDTRDDELRAQRLAKDPMMVTIR